MPKKIYAFCLALALIMLGLAAPAAATQPPGPNRPEYWEERYPNAVACYKVEGAKSSAHGTISQDKKSITLVPFQQSWLGDRWEVLIVKGGSVDTGFGPGNAVYDLPSAGVAYSAPNNNGGNVADVSHWIVCKGETPAPPPTPKVATASVSTAPATCEVGETLVYGPVSNAVLSGTPNGTAGPGAYSVTATATGGAQFAGGQPSMTFTGTLAGPNIDLCSIPEKPNPITSVKTDEDVDCEAGTVTTTVTTTVTDWVLQGRTWVLDTPVVKTQTTTRPANGSECPTVPAFPSVSVLSQALTCTADGLIDTEEGGVFFEETEGVDHYLLDGEEIGYGFTALEPGTYTVTAVLRPGYHTVDPWSEIIEVRAGIKPDCTKPPVVVPRGGAQPQVVVPRGGAQPLVYAPRYTG